MISLILLCLLIVVAIYALKNKDKDDLPPGPSGVPFLGFIPFLGKQPHITIAKLRKKYGNVIRIPFGPKSIVILNDLDAVKEALIKQSQIFSGRPRISLKNDCLSKDIIFSHGPIWKQQRFLSIRILRGFGSTLENNVMLEVDQLTNLLNENAGKPIDISTLFLLPIFNVLWNMIAGKRFEKLDDFMFCFKKFGQQFESQTNNILLSSLPFLRTMIPKLHKQREDFQDTTRQLTQYVENEFENHATNFYKNNLKDFIDVYLDEINQHKRPDGMEVPPYNRKHLLGTIIDLFIAGEDTTNTSMCWALLHMVKHPEVQRKVQEELDGVIAMGSYLPLSSKSLCPYTEATIMEIHRHTTLIPLGSPHTTIKDTTLFGYKIPKNTRILPNIYAVHHDERYWDSPDSFRPERFLDETGKNIIKHESFIPFSLGARFCMGESLAKLELHLLFTCLLRRFTFETVPGQETISMEPIPGNLLKPIPYSLIIKPR